MTVNECHIPKSMREDITRIADALERLAPSGSASGALLSDPLAGQRQGDPLASTSELPFADQAEARAGRWFDQADRYTRNAAYLEDMDRPESAEYLRGFSAGLSRAGCELMGDLSDFKAAAPSESNEDERCEGMADGLRCIHEPGHVEPCQFDASEPRSENATENPRTK